MNEYPISASDLHLSWFSESLLKEEHLPSNLIHSYSIYCV
uniref:Uncharacterized protein n=1 Tax=Arundo donax TaxID=35708 RepID=A0A0A9BKT0_ARUDO